MKVGFFTDSYFPRKDGLVYTIRTWKERLEERGHDVYVIYPGSEHVPEKGEIPTRSLGNPFYCHDIGLPTSYPDIPELDILHVHSPGPVGLMGMRYGSKRDIPMVYTFHTPLEDYVPQVIPKRLARPLGGLVKALEERIMNSFELVTSNTDKLPRDVDFESLPVGIDMDYFRYTESSIIEDMGLERPVAGYSGRLSEEKRLDDVIDFFEDIDAQLVIAGEGRDRERLEERAGENVVFRDFIEREKLPDFYSGLDVFVTASESDTLSLTTLEASACGTPVLAPDVHPFTETVDGNGERFSPGDAQDFRLKFNKINENEYRTREAVEQYSVDKTVDRLLDIYGEIT